MADSSKNPIHRATIRIESPIDTDQELSAPIAETEIEPSALGEQPQRPTQEALVISEKDDTYEFTFPDCSTRTALDEVLIGLDDFFSNTTVRQPCLLSFALVSKISVSVIGALHEHTKDIRQNGIDIIFEIPIEILEKQKGLEALLLKHFQVKKI